MKLEFDGRRSEQDILSFANNCKFNQIVDFNKSLLIKGDNLIGLSYLLQNGYKNKIDLVYIDPPYNTNQIYYLSAEGRSNTISKSTNGIVAYTDKFTLEEYLSFMRDRLVLIYNLLSEQGSLYVHIDSKMGHYIKLLLDEIFGIDNFKNDITRIKSNPKNFDRNAFGNQKDMILFYVKNKKLNIWNNIRTSLTNRDIEKLYPKSDGRGRYTTIPLHAPGETVNGCTGMDWRGMKPPIGRHWRTSPDEFENLDEKGLIEWSSNGNPRIKKYLKDSKGKKVQDVWEYKDPQYPMYPTQKNQKMIEFIIEQSSNRDSIVLDCFAGGGTTMLASEKKCRKWIGIDQSDLSIEIINKQLSGKADYNFLNLTLPVIKN